MMVERWLGVPVRRTAPMPASLSASATLSRRSWNCTNTSTRSSLGMRLMSPITELSLTPVALLAPPAAPSPPPPSEPSSATGITHEGRAGALQCGCSMQSCSSALRCTSAHSPTWPQHESSAWVEPATSIFCLFCAAGDDEAAAAAADVERPSRRHRAAAAARSQRSGADARGPSPPFAAGAAGGPGHASTPSYP